MTFKRLIGDGNLISGMLKMLESKAKNLPRQALRIWTLYVTEIAKGKILEQVKAQTLKNNLKFLSIRILKDSFERVLG